MATLKISMDGEEKALEYSYKAIEGMYFTVDATLAEKNCDTFNIQLTEPVEEKISRIRDIVIITTKAVDEYVQCTIFKSVDENELYEFASNIHPRAGENIITAYKILNMSTRLG